MGIGYHTPIGKNIDLVGTLEYIDAETDFSGETSDSSGHIIGVGLRAMLTDVIEVGGSIKYGDFSDDSDTGFAVYGRYFTTRKVSLGVGYGVAEFSACLGRTSLSAYVLSKK